MTYQPHQSEDTALKTVCDNPKVLCQDCCRPLFRWFLSRIDWKRILKQMPRRESTRSNAGGQQE